MNLWIFTAALLFADPRTAGAQTGRKPAAAEFSFERVEDEARDLAARPFSAPIDAIPPPMAGVTYNQYLEIRPDVQRALWAGAPGSFRAAFYPRGYLYRRPVEIEQVIDGRSEPVRFSKDFFTWGAPELKDTAPDDLGFAGLRILYPVNRPDHLDELISFLGAAYFRALGRGQFYGASVRGLALNPGAGPGEEFPSFRKLWIEKPAPEARSVTLHALLDGPSVTGAYRFDVKPGDDTTVEVQAVIYLRRPVEAVGLAPITSMFLFGQKKRGFSSDPRPQVHDCDGLILGGNQGAWTWRPLENPAQPRTSRVPLPRGAGFGLWQRDRDPDHYRDGCHYELRPGIWVEPLDRWPEGSVALLELPTDGEWQDNITCYFLPAAPVPVGTAYRVHYRLHFGMELPGPFAGSDPWKP